MHGYLTGHYLQMQSAARRSSPPPGFRKEVSFRNEVSSPSLPKDVSSRFGLRLRELRRSNNMTQLRMAIDFGIDRSFISDVERGRKSISLPMLEVLALGLKLSLSDLLDGI
jgi:DNA-binding XRE family transcriptional regulator